MKQYGRWFVAVMAMATIVLVGGQWIGQAAAQHDHGGHHATGETQTLKGEVVDLSCYLGHDAKGASHKQCAIACLKKGLPMGLRTSDGKLYLVLEDHDQADAYQSLKDKVAQTVTVTGRAVVKDHLKGILITAVK